MKIREFKKQDAEKLSKIIIKNLKTVNIKDYPLKAINALISHNSPKSLIDKSKTGIVIVAEIDKKIVGTTCLYDNRVANVFVDIEYHGKGIGAALMKRIEEIAMNKNIKDVFTLAGLTAVEFYKKLGYKIITEVEPDIDGTKVKMIRMEKHLKSK